jgi:hypothetical protein
MGGSSIDQSNTPHPNREEQAARVALSAAQASIMKILCKKFFLPLRMKNYYGRKRDNWQCTALPLTLDPQVCNKSAQVTVFFKTRQ